MALTIDEARELSRRAESEVFGDGGGCFEADGTERTERIRECVTTWNYGYKGDRGLPSYGAWLRFWAKRHGQPWQADIEKWVSEWRAEPRPFATDDVLALTLLDKYNNWDIYRLAGRFTCHIRNLPECDKEWAVVQGEAAGSTIAEAVCRATLAAVGAKGDR